MQEAQKKDIIPNQEGQINSCCEMLELSIENLRKQISLLEDINAEQQKRLQTINHKSTMLLKNNDLGFAIEVLSDIDNTSRSRAATMLLKDVKQDIEVLANISGL